MFLGWDPVRTWGWFPSLRYGPRDRSGKSSAMVSAGGDVEFAQHTQELRVDEAQLDPTYNTGSGVSDLLNDLGLQGTRSSQYPCGPCSPQPSCSTVERGRVSARSLRGREPSVEDRRFDRLTSMMEELLVLMDRLEDDRSSRRSGASQVGDQPHTVKWGGYGVGFTDTCVRVRGSATGCCTGAFVGTRSGAATQGDAGAITARRGSVSGSAQLHTQPAQVQAQLHAQPPRKVQVRSKRSLPHTA